MNDENVIQHFLFVYDRKADKLLRLEEFGTDAEAALAAYEAAEIEHMWQKHMDIVLLSSTSLESIRHTHGNYFDGGARRSVERALTLAF